MAITMTEMFSGRTYSSRTATRVFDVVGATDERDALLATGIPRTNDRHPLAPSSLDLLALPPVSARRTVNLYRVTVTYQKPEGSGTHRSPEDDPLDDPPVVGWSDVNRQAEIDSDVDGNPLVNSAREAFRQRPSDYFSEYHLIMERNQPFFDVDFAHDMRLTVNSTPLTISGIHLVPALGARLMVMRPTQAYVLDTPYVRVRFEWEIRPQGFAPDGVSPHALRIKDVGMRAAGLNAAGESQLALLHDRNKAGMPEDPVTQDAPLDGTGGPLKADALGRKLAIGIDDLTAAVLAAPTGATVEVQDDARFLWYSPPRLRAEDHNFRLGLP